MKNEIIDLTQIMEENMPVYPGTAEPKFEAASIYEIDGFREMRLTMCSHNGTHMDAPAHIFAKGTSLDKFSVSHFIGRGLVIDCREVGEGEEIPMERIQRVRAQADRADYLLFLTGWSRFWGEGAYFGEYPVISSEICRYIVDSGKKGIGLDTVGVDPVDDEALTRHRLLLQHEIVIVENLKNIELLTGEPFLFAALPLKIRDADGAPVRAVGILQR